MANCRQCGTSIGLLTVRGEGLCPRCHKLNLKDHSSIESKEDAALRHTLEDDINAVLLTTETQSDLKIVERFEVISAECAFGMNIFKDLFAGVRDVFGGRSEAVQKTMRDSRRTVLHELKREAHRLGANAVVGVDLDYVELSASGNMVLLVASGTAVKILEEDE